MRVVCWVEGRIAKSFWNWLLRWKRHTRSNILPTIIPNIRVLSFKSHAQKNTSSNLVSLVWHHQNVILVVNRHTFRWASQQSWSPSVERLPWEFLGICHQTLKVLREVLCRSFSWTNRVISMVFNGHVCIIWPNSLRPSPAIKQNACYKLSSLPNKYPTTPHPKINSQHTSHHTYPSVGMIFCPTEPGSLTRDFLCRQIVDNRKSLFKGQLSTKMNVPVREDVCIVGL